MDIPSCLIPIVFAIKDEDPAIRIEMRPNEHGTTDWVIARGGDVMTRDGRWEVDSPDRAQDREFLAMTRHAKVESALKIFVESKGDSAAAEFAKNAWFEKQAQEQGAESGDWIVEYVQSGTTRGTLLNGEDFPSEESIRGLFAKRCPQRRIVSMRRMP